MQAEFDQALIELLGASLQLLAGRQLGEQLGIHGDPQGPVLLDQAEHDQQDAKQGCQRAGGCSQQGRQAKCQSQQGQPSGQPIE
ncbi:hypothetical protein D3C84_977560 [compost metagenome]